MRIILCIGLMAIGLMAKGQECGTILTGLPGWTQDDLSAHLIPERAPIDTVGVSVHILSDDLFPVTQIEIQDQIDIVNELFAPVGVYFFICSIGEVYSKGSFTSAEIAEVNKRMHIPNRLNLYIPTRLTTAGSFKICGQAMFPWENEPAERYIVVSRKCLDDGTFAHEFGHYYGLLHTHETSFGVERVDGSNCSYAGDQICDTPADPLLGPGHMRGCDYIGSLRDPNGDLYAPDPSFIMSYGPKDCRTKFSNQQYAVMRYYAQSEHQHYVSSCEELPDIFIDIEEIPDTISFNHEISFFVHMVNTLQTDTAIDLTVQISTDRIFFDDIVYSEVIQSGEGNGNILREVKFRIPSALNDGRFFIRVYADAQQNHTEGNEYNNFVTREFILDHSVFDEPTLFPNPASNYLHYFYRGERSGEAVIRIFNSAGQMIRNMEISSGGAEIYANIDLTGIPAGAYVLQLFLLNERRTESSRFVISR